MQMVLIKMEIFHKVTKKMAMTEMATTMTVIIEMGTTGKASTKMAMMQMVLMEKDMTKKILTLNISIVKD